jgi:hypothetical protein
VLKVHKVLQAQYKELKVLLVHREFKVPKVLQAQYKVLKEQ